MIRKILLAIMLMSLVVAPALAQGGIYVPDLTAQAKVDTMIDVGGYSINARIYGEGSPVVVLVTGFGAPQEYMNGIVNEVSKHTTVVTYDRPGYGKSELGEKPRTALQNAQDLHVLLQKLDVKGPFVMAGHSYGCRVASLFASEYPEMVRSVILMDPTHPDFQDAWMQKLTADEKARFDELYAQMKSTEMPGGPGAELKQTDVSLQELRNITSLPNVPCYVLVAPLEGRIKHSPMTLSEESTRAFMPLAKEYMQKLVDKWPQGHYVDVENTTHHIPIDRPDAVIDSILQLLK